MYTKAVKFFSKTFSFLKKRDSSFNPNRDWKIIVFTFFIVNLALVSYLLLFYFRLGDYDTRREIGESKIEFLNKDSIYYVLDNYVAKEEHFQFLSENRPVISDPSN